MADKPKFQLPAEYADVLIDEEQYLQKRRNSAVENAKTRTTSLPAPKWWDTEKYGYFQDCIGTATSNFGEDNTEIGNQTFLKNHQAKGFNKLQKNENLQEGDIVQYVDELGIPMHSVMVTGFDEKGFPITSYSNGSGVYKTNNTMHRTLENPGWTANYYRYIGTPAERQAIAEHNAAIRARNAASVQPIPAPIQGIPVQPAQPEQAKRRLSIFDIARGDD